MSTNFERINQHAKPLLFAILRRLLPHGRVEGHEYVALNPTRADKHLGSFRINLRTGKWGDFATDDFGGDVISLYAYLQSCRQSEALQAISNIIGLSDKLSGGGR